MNNRKNPGLPFPTPPKLVDRLLVAVFTNTCHSLETIVAMCLMFWFRGEGHCDKHADWLERAARTHDDNDDDNDAVVMVRPATFPSLAPGSQGDQNLLSECGKSRSGCFYWHAYDVIAWRRYGACQWQNTCFVRVSVMALA